MRPIVNKTILGTNPAKMKIELAVLRQFILSLKGKWNIVNQTKELK